MVAGEIACFRQRSASYWPATSPCAREGFHPPRKVVGIRVEALIELIQFVGLFRSGCAPGSATGISCLRISVSTGADIVGKRMVFRLSQAFKRMHFVDRIATIAFMVVVRA